MVISVFTLSSTVTLHERMYCEPLNGIPTSSMTTDGAGTAGEREPHYLPYKPYCLLLCTNSVTLQLSVNWRLISGMEMVTLQVYTPPCDVSRGEKVNLPVSGCTEPLDSDHCTVGGVVRVTGTFIQHSTERGWPAVEVSLISFTISVVTSAGEMTSYEKATSHVPVYI